MNIPKIRCNLCHEEIWVSLTGYAQDCFGLLRKRTENGDREFEGITHPPSIPSADMHLCSACEFGLRKLFKDEPFRMSSRWESDMDKFLKSEMKTYNHRPPLGAGVHPYDTGHREVEK